MTLGEGLLQEVRPDEPQSWRRFTGTFGDQWGVGSGSPDCRAGASASGSHAHSQLEVESASAVRGPIEICSRHLPPVSSCDVLGTRSHCSAYTAIQWRGVFL